MLVFKMYLMAIFITSTITILVIVVPLLLLQLMLFFLIQTWMSGCQEGFHLPRLGSVSFWNPK